MIESSEVRILRQLILDDDRTLDALRKREAEIRPDVETHEFRAATTRANVLSEIRVAEERLRENRERLAALIHKQ